ncbi:MAG: hypothetical protein IPI49_30210 [Myxococcales bacterium]|nr:hypothetical protein [Myxococcales bacterium]
MTSSFLRFGDHHAYDGDKPWWTLRFATPPSKAQHQALRRLVLEALDGVADVEDWDSTRQVLLSATDPYFESAAEWNAFYRDVDTLLLRIHEQFGLLAVFFQDGQSYGDGQSLSKEPDETLRQLANR